MNEQVLPPFPTRRSSDLVSFYDSKNLGASRMFYVYTPPGYESNQQKYPVLYLLHGNGQIESSWTWTGRANVRSEEHTSELQSHHDLVCRLLLEKNKSTPD